MVPCAPSNSIRLPCAMASASSAAVSHTSGRIARRTLQSAGGSRRNRWAVVQIESLRQRLLIFGQRVVELAEALGIEQIGHADPAPPGLVFVARADPTRRGADRNAILARLGHFLHQPVKRKNHMRAIADAQLDLRTSMPAASSMRHFFEQRRQIHHHAVADHRLTPARRMPLGISLRTNFFSPI